MINIIGNIILSATSAAAAVVSRIVTDGLKMWLPFERTEVIGKNIYDGNITQAINGGTFTDNSDGTFTVTGNGSPNVGIGVRDFNAEYLVVGNYYKFSVQGSNTTLAVYNSSFVLLTTSQGSVEFEATTTDIKLYISPTDGVTATYSNVEIKEVTQVAPDTSGNLNNAKLYSGKALSFDGLNDYVDVSGFSMSGSVSTFAFWINSNDTLGRVIDINPNRFIISFNNNQLSLYDGNWKNFGTINTNVWNRCVILTSGTSAKCYVNGVQLGEEKTITAISISSATDAIIGANIAHNQSFFNGEITDLQIYNTAWTEADITYDYNKPNHLVTDNPSTNIALSNLKGYWALSEGDGAIAYDSSGEGNNGTINGATYVDAQPTIPQLGMMDWSKGSNLYLNSEPTSDEGSAANITYATYSWNYRQFDNATVFGDNSVTRYRYGGTVSPSTETTLSVFVIMDDNSEPNITNSSSSGDFSIVLKGSVSFGTNLKTNVSGNIWRVSKTVTTTSGTSLLSNNGIIKYSNQSSKGFKVVGWQLEESSSPTAYRRTNGTAVTDATLIANPNNPSQDILGNSVRLREHSFNLDGTGYAEVADAISINPTDAITVECWIYWTNTSFDKGIVAKLTSGANKDYALYQATTTKFDFYIGSQNKRCDTDLSNGWNHIVGTYDRTNMKVYLNGELDGTLSYTSAIPNTTQVLEIGRYNNSESKSYSERIDDVRIYDRALSADEILNNHTVGLPEHQAGSDFSDDFSSDYGN